MTKIRWQVIFAVVLIVVSAMLFTAHFFIFHDVYDIFFYLFHGIAFIPIQVIIVGLIIDKIIEKKEKEKMMKKLNMVIGLFFSEVGHNFVEEVSKHDKNLENSMELFRLNSSQSLKEMCEIKDKLKNYKGELEIDIKTLVKVRDILLKKRDFLVKLIENPLLLDHDTFTELLMAIFHISEEFVYRCDIENLSDEDVKHLANDVVRAYNYIVIEWIVYIIYLKKEYPYLYNSAVLTNPFLKKPKT